MGKLVISTGLAKDGNYQTFRQYPIIGYHNVLSELSFDSTTAAEGFPVTNLGNPSTNSLWKGTGGSTDEYVTFAVGGFAEGTTTGVDYVGIARHNLGTIAALISLEYESSPGNWTVLVSAFTPADDSPILMRFPNAEYQNIRLRIEDATDNPYIAVIYAGRILTLERKIYVGHTPADLNRKSNIVNAVSENGNFLGRIVLSEMKGTQVSMQNLTPVWVREHLDHFIVAAKEVPFFIAWRPYEYPKEVNFAWMNDNPSPTNQLPNGMMSCSFALTAISK